MKIYKIFTITVLLSTLTACNDWLDVTPQTDMDRGALFKNEAGFADAMSGIYANMSSNEAYGKALTWHGVEQMGGGVFTPNGLYNIQRFEFHPDAPKYVQDNVTPKYTESLRNSFVDAAWNKVYNTIAGINSMLACIDDKKGEFTGHDYEIFKGEALGLRAFLHFDLLRLFGDARNSSLYSPTKTYIPYVSSLTANVYPLLTFDECCKLILNDLTQAKELLKNDPMYTGAEPSTYVCSKVAGDATDRTDYNIKDWHNRRFHFNYYAAVATMARVYLWMGDKANALACAKEVIDAVGKALTWVNPTLVTNLEQNMPPCDRTFCTEQVFSLNILDLFDRTDGYFHEGKYSLINGAMGFNTNSFDEASRRNDYRYKYLKKVRGKINQNDDLCLTNKYDKDTDEDKLSPWSVNRLPLIRLSEMYYIAAECEPNLQTAVSYLKTVRDHRGLAAEPLVCNTREDLDAEIEIEYQREFIAEGQLFYYYKRKNKEIENIGGGEKAKIPTELFTMPRPDDEDTFGGRTK